MTAPGPETTDDGRRWFADHRALVVFSVVPAVAVVALVVALLVVPAGGGDETPRRAVAPAPTTTTTTTPRDPDAGPFPIATVITTDVPVHAEPSATSPTITTLGPVTTYGITTTLAVADVPTRHKGWVPVVVPFHKPNGTVGWVPSTHVRRSQTTFLIKISLGARHLVLLDDGEEVLSTSVIIGTPSTPTPLGRFWVTDPVNCNTTHVPGHPVAQCDAAYGEFALGLSGLSEALDSFKGTIPQIAIHGTDLPDTEMGKDLSNGCIRTPNGIVRLLGAMVPLGTPVEITA